MRKGPDSISAPSMEEQPGPPLSQMTRLEESLEGLTNFQKNNSDEVSVVSVLFVIGRSPAYISGTRSVGMASRPGNVVTMKFLASKEVAGSSREDVGSAHTLPNISNEVNMFSFIAFETFYSCAYKAGGRQIDKEGREKVWI
ncbi:hypothetical protein WICPIJ_006103 [Wickerhamomyces pijperi]|uniref:Uncharacterized protein n=1 Tax=Wickerhamomyces pijperi TaxID=599730 RepID=A0A9P8Q2P5_WICPI|nr:hypothetical protein WICPIJ_006103 [Wickerhamomyces pijperi]